MAEIELKDVRKVYGGNIEAIKGVSLTIADGEMIVLVGPSGCGKSTLLRMIAGLEGISSGDIAIGGRVINTLEPAERDITMVFQNYALYPHMTVRQNLSYGLKNRNTPKDEIDRRVLEAATALEIEPFLDRKPRQLSGGQRQRVVIARALLRDTPILLLDEATSALDTRSETVVQAALDKLSTGRTTLVIAHRLSTVRDADKILVMDKGQVVDEGTHEELLAQGGIYADLYELQFKTKGETAEARALKPAEGFNAALPKPKRSMVARIFGRLAGRE